MSGSAFAVTHHAFSSGAGRTSDGNGSHASTLKSPSYTKSVSWQHYLGGEYDVLLTNRLILQPSYEVNFYSQDDESRGRGRGLTDTELGLRLRYEIRREFAPYIGVSWNQLYGKTSDMAKREGEKDHQVVFWREPESGFNALI